MAKSKAEAHRQQLQAIHDGFRVWISWEQQSVSTSEDAELLVSAYRVLEAMQSRLRNEDKSRY